MQLVSYSLRYLHKLYAAESTPHLFSVKSKGIPRQAEVALGVPGRLRPQIFLTFGTTRVVGRQPNAPAAFTPGEIPGTHFQRLSHPQGTWFCQKEPWKKSQVTPPGIDPGTVRLVVQRLNHYATPGPHSFSLPINFCLISVDTYTVKAAGFVFIKSYVNPQCHYIMLRFVCGVL